MDTGHMNTSAATMYCKGAFINHMTLLREGGGQLECQRGVIREGGGQWECHMTIYFTFCKKKNKNIKKIIIFK